jgi:hypothetical protein
MSRQLNRQRVWSRVEEELLSDVWPTLSPLDDRDILLGCFPDRSLSSIKSKAFYMGLKCVSSWSDDEKTLLTDIYGERWHDEQYLLNALPGRTMQGIRGMAKKLKITSDRSTISSVVARKYNVNHNFFSVPGVLNSYWAGFIAADGCVRKNELRVRLAEKDLGHLELFRTHIEAENPIRVGDHFSFDKKSRYALLVISSSSLVRDLRDHYNITERKSLTLQPPVLEGDCKRAFMRGLLDGDGHIGVTKSGYLRGSMCGNPRVISWYKNSLCRIVPEYTGNKIIECSDVHHRLQFQGGKAHKLFKWLADDDGPRLTRKWSIYEELR